MTWLKQIKGRVNYVLANEFDYMFANKEEEEDVLLERGGQFYEIFPQIYPVATTQSATFFICPPFFTALLLTKRSTNHGLNISDFIEDVKEVATAVFAFWQQDVYDLETVVWNAAAHIQFQKSIDLF